MPASCIDFRRDRRLAFRLALTVPLTHRIWRSGLPEQSAEAVNISDRGLFFVTDSRYSQGEPIELRFDMPESVAREPSTEWLCTGHVVRIEELPDSKFGIAVQFDCYDVARPKDPHVSSAPVSIPSPPTEAVPSESSVASER